MNCQWCLVFIVQPKMVKRSPIRRALTRLSPFLPSVDEHFTADATVKHEIEDIKLVKVSADRCALCYERQTRRFMVPSLFPL